MDKKPGDDSEAVSGVAGVGRREVLQGLLGGVGAGLSVPLLAEAHPVESHMADPLRVARAGAKAKDPAWTPEFLDAHAHETLDSMAERIVPGSAQARVARFVDSLLAVDSTENQRRFLHALGVLEGECITRFGHPWKSLSEAQQAELLTLASTMSPGRGERPWAPGRAGVTSANVDADRPTLRDQFDHIKKWVAGAYYSTEAGMRELGWTGHQFFDSFPGCPHPDGHR